MSEVKRNYRTKDVDMMVSALTIVEAARKNKTFLISKRSSWADPFFDNLLAKINTVTQKYLGADNAAALRTATDKVTAQHALAMTSAAEVKVQITYDFNKNKERGDEVLKLLGFTSYLKAAQKGDQEAMINLLYQFKTNLTSDLKTEIIAAGTDEAALQAVMVYADTMKDANVTQEGHKGGRIVLTAEAIEAFNEIYDATIAIAGIAAKFFKGQPAIKQQFSFAKTSKALNQSVKPAAPPAPTT